MRESHHVVDLARRTTFLEPRFYDYIRSDRIAQREARLLAEQAWGEMSGTVPNASADYQNGFTEGFADYLYRGGEGEPPVIPPRGYWNLRFLNQFGRLTINDWYEGFRHGVQVCKSSGLRSMWLVPTSLLGGLEEEDSLPKSEDQLWSADPDLTINKLIREPDPELDSLTNPEQPPVPDPASEDDEEEAASDSSIDDDDEDSELPRPQNDNDEITDATTDDASANPFGNDTLDDNRDPLFEPTETDPLDDVLAPDPIEPDAEKIEDDIFGAPEGTFDSSDSFEVDDLDFNFQGNSQTPKSNRPLAIRAVSPVAQIPSYLQENSPSPIAVTSGQYDDDIPSPPRGMLITSSENAAPTPPVRAIKPNTAADPPMSSLPLLIVPSKKRSTTRPAIQRSPRQQQRKTNSATISQPHIGNSLTVTDMVMDAQPIARQPSSQPITMWLDDSVPATPVIPNAPPTKDEVNWEPFDATDSSPTDLQSAGNHSLDEDFGALKYEDILDDRMIERSTQWTPQREKELPLRVGTRTPRANSNNSRPSPQTPRMKLRAEAETRPKIADLKIGSPSELNELPKIYVRPQSTNIIQPFEAPENSGRLKVDSVDESALRWRDRN